LKTISAKPEEVERGWYVVDAQGQTLGRLASRVATVLRGKHKPIYTPHVDCGDYVIVVNAEKIHVTGQKMTQKSYYRHSGYPGGLKEVVLRDQLQKFPERVIESAVRGMLPKNRLGRSMFKKLKVYAGPNHPHQAQQPQSLEFKF
jgi:large subunit ribosomal protein L13